MSRKACYKNELLVKLIGNIWPFLKTRCSRLARRRTYLPVSRKAASGCKPSQEMKPTGPLGCYGYSLHLVCKTLDVFDTFRAFLGTNSFFSLTVRFKIELFLLFSFHGNDIFGLTKYLRIFPERFANCKLPLVLQNVGSADCSHF